MHARAHTHAQGTQLSLELYNSMASKGMTVGHEVARAVLRMQRKAAIQHNR